MFFAGPLVPPKYNVRDVMTAWTTASATGPPRFCSIITMADVGPIRSKPTSVIAESASGTMIIPIPMPPNVTSVTRVGKYGMARSSVEP